jgi:hypothetical protein
MHRQSELVPDALRAQPFEYLTRRVLPADFPYASV